jgi:hypothetical protein
MAIALYRGTPSVPLVPLGVLLTLGLAPLTSCGNNGGLEPDPSSDAPTSGETRSSAEPSAACDVPIFEEEPGAEPFERLTATVLDETGEPVPDLLVQACGLDVCLNGKTSAQGRATIASDESISKLAFKYGDGLRYAQIVLLLEGETNYELGEQLTVALPTGDPDNRFEAGSLLSSSDVTLELADDAEVRIDVLSYADSSEHLFVAKSFDEAAFPAAAENQNFASVWALGPAKTEICPPATLSLPNSTGLEPNTSVDLLLLITDVSGRHGRYAEWAEVASATVSADGDAIVTDEGRGIPELGLIGVRPRR